MAHSLCLTSYCDNYHTDHPSLAPRSPVPPDVGGAGGEELMECAEGGVDMPPHLMSHLSLLLSGGAGNVGGFRSFKQFSRMVSFQVPFPLPSAVCQRTALMVKVCIP